MSKDIHCLCPPVSGMGMFLRDAAGKAPAALLKQLFGMPSGEDLNRLWSAIESYMAARPHSSQPGLAPFFAANGPDDVAAQ